MGIKTYEMKVKVHIFLGIFRIFQSLNFCCVVNPIRHYDLPTLSLYISLEMFGHSILIKYINAYFFTIISTHEID